METRSIDPTTALGVEPRMAAALAYLAWWVTGTIVLFVEKDNRFVRFHALQSILALGTVSLIAVVLWLGSFASLVITGSAFLILMRMAQAVWLVGLIAWMICLYQAASGRWFKLPAFGDLAERRIRGTRL